MVSYRSVLQTVEGALGPDGRRGKQLTAAQRGDLFYALSLVEDDLRDLLARKPCSEQDRGQVRSKEVQLPDGPPAVLDSKDVQLALQLSDAFVINEVDSVALLVAAHHEWGIAGRADSDVVRLAAGLWFTERRALLSTLFLLLKVAVLGDSAADPLLLDHVRRYLRSLVQSGLTARLFRLLRELNRPDASGSGSQSLALVVAGAGPPAGASPVAGGGEGGGGGGGGGIGEYVMDGRGLLARRWDVVQRERLLVAQCVALSCLLTRLDPKETKELFELLQDAARDWSAATSAAASASASSSSTPLALPPIPSPLSLPAPPSSSHTTAFTAAHVALTLQITYTLMFALLLALLSDSLASPSSSGGIAGAAGAAPASPSMSASTPPVLAPNEAFRKEFSRLVLKTTPSPTPPSSSNALVPFQSGPLSLPPQPSSSPVSSSSPPNSSPLTPPAPDDVISVIRLAWAVFLANTSTLPAFSAPSLSPSRTSARGSVAVAALTAGGSGEEVVGDELAVARECLKDETLLSASSLLLQRVLSSAVFENDDEDLTFTFMVYTHKLLSSFFLQPITRERIRELRHASLSLPFPPLTSSSSRPAHADVDKAARLAGAYPHSMGRGVARSLEEEDEREQRQQQREEAEAQEQVAVRGRAYLGLLQLVGAVYARQPELMGGNGVLWQFVMYVGEEHRGAASLVAFLNLLSQLATGEEGSRQVHELLNGRHLRSVSWHALMQSLQVYDDRLRQAFQDSSLPYQHQHQQHHPSLFPPEDAAVLEAYIRCLHAVLQSAPPAHRTRLFSDAFFDALFRLLPHAAVPPALKAALRSAIAAFLGGPATASAVTTTTAAVPAPATAASGGGGGGGAWEPMAVAAAAAGLTPAAAAALAARTWALEEFYDLPPSTKAAAADNQPWGAEQATPSAPYDMGMELNEVEARVEEYPSTLSYLRLHNTLLALDPLSRPARFLEYFQFVKDSVFVPYTRRVYARADEMWHLLLSSLSLFQLALLLLQRAPLQSPPPLAALSASSANGTLPAGATPGLLLMKDFLSAGPALRNILAIISAGPDSLLEERAMRPQALSFALEDTVAASLRLLLLALSLDQSLADTWQPAVRPLHLVLGEDVGLVTAVMSFVRYQPSDVIQQSAIELTSVFSARGVPLVAMALEAGAVQRLVEDFAECLDVSASSMTVEGAGSVTVDGGENGEQEEGGDGGEQADCATLILQLLLTSLRRQPPSLAHMLLGFDVERPLAASVLQPNRRFSALRILLDLVLSAGAEDKPESESDQPDAPSPPRVSLRLARLREMSARVLYLLAADPATAGPTAVLLQAKPFDFFAPMLSSALLAPLPRRSSSPIHRVACLHEHAWLLKLLALALHTTPPASHPHKHHTRHAAPSAITGRQLEIWRQILSALFMADGGVGGATEVGEGGSGALVVWGGGEQQAEGARGDVLGAIQLLDSFLFSLPDVAPKFPPHIAAVHQQLQLEELLGTAASVADGGVFEVNERGDRLVDLAALSHILSERFSILEAQRGPGAPFLPGPNLGVAGAAAGSAEIRQEAVREALRFVWRRNRVEEEAAAQQHVALAWAQLLQMALSRRFDLLPPHARLEALLQLLSSCLRAIAAPHVSLTLAKPISQVVLVAFLQLQHLSSSSPSSTSSSEAPSSDDAGEVTWSDVIGQSSLSDASSREGLGGGGGRANVGGSGGGRRQVSLSECTGLLRDLLGALMRKDSSDSLRRRLYTSLLAFLTICSRRFRNADVDISPAVMGVILKELPGEEASSDRSLDMLERQRREVQRATHALLTPHLPALIRTLSHDASSSPSPLTRSLALAALSSLLSHSSDPIAASASLAPTNGIATAGRDNRSIFAQSVGGQSQNLPIGFGRLPDLAPGMTSSLAVASTSAAAVLTQMQAHGMVQACIADVSKGITEVLLLPSADSQRQAFVTEAHLSLLLSIASSTGRQGLLLLLNAGFLRAMAACPSLDAPISESSYLAPTPVGLSPLDAPSESLRFAHLVSPVLRLLLALSALAPPDASLSPHAAPSDATSKADVASQLVDFAAHHEAMLSRLLEDRSPSCNATDLLLLSLCTALLSRALLWASASQLVGVRGLMMRVAAAYSVGDGESRVKYIRQRVGREEDDRVGEIGGISLSLLVPEEEHAMVEGVLRVRANLMSHLRSLVAFKGLLLPATSKHQHQGPTLSLLSDLLRQMVIDLQAAVEARGTALTKLMDVNDMSRHEAEELIKATAFHAHHSHAHLSLRQARRQALLILASLASTKERALTWILFISEHLLHILLAHFSLHHTLLNRSSPLPSSLSPSPTTFSSRPRSLRVQGPRLSPSPAGVDGAGFGAMAGGEEGEAAAAGPGGVAGAVQSREEFESVVGTSADLEAVAREVLPSVNRLVEVNEDRVGCSTDYMKRLALSLRSSLLLQFHL
ncbi:hypothetical protein CLOM_g11148 [Closterium sp. NIES-68]|nr:hypothetical protein CLOM_g11148 [Closterium sp. NIES-68]GJP79570.1 hypothetical protein CLOP_g9791 [Closterium sp. NIES-67]